jgi:lipopolysaccharide transport system ATP-binding protein
LKVLTRITPPTAGWAEIHGRAGALLEVGTGFHQELTGRENVFLNGAILGMRRAEILRQFDAIVDFSGVERFLDTPVKRYSSGMYVRLAFAVAAHLEPDVLIVDEVLAVGDADFQRKCLARMNAVASEGRTVLFVSHNMAVLQSLCTRGIVLRSGDVVTDASIADATSTYLRDLERGRTVPLSERTDRRGWQVLRLDEIVIQGESGSAVVAAGQSLGLEFRYVGSEFLGSRPDVSLQFTIHDELSRPVTTLDSAKPAPDDDRDGRPGAISCVLAELPLAPGRYRIDVVLRAEGHRQDDIQGAAWFDVAEGMLRGRPVTAGPGVVALAHQWSRPADVR